VSFRVPAGEIFGLLGANGAGKTTVIKMLTGIIPPSAGTGRVAGADVQRAGRAIKERIGYMSQAFSLYQDLTAVENIRLYAGIYGLGAAQARRCTESIIEITGLGGQEGELAGRLPVGLRQRLALGCALVPGPQILFLDEPTSGVDPIGRRRFWEILFRLSRQDGVAILVTTHYMSEAEHCDHLALMHGGRVVADASPSEMKRQIGAEAGRLLDVTCDQPLLALQRLEGAGLEGVALFGSHIHLLARDRELAERRIRAALQAAGVTLLGIVERPLSMEDVFVYRVLSLERQERVAA
jgi:ABC-type multidrug transport system ATPase subunit